MCSIGCQFIVAFFSRISCFEVINICSNLHSL